MGRTTQKAGAEKVRSWLIELREAAGMTQGQVAEEAGISQPSYCDIENGVTKTPKMETSKKLAAFIGEPWTRFYEEDENE